MQKTANWSRTSDRFVCFFLFSRLSFDLNLWHACIIIIIIESVYFSRPMRHCYSCCFELHHNTRTNDRLQKFSKTFIKTNSATLMKTIPIIHEYLIIIIISIISNEWIRTSKFSYSIFDDRVDLVVFFFLLTSPSSFSSFSSHFAHFICVLWIDLLYWHRICVLLLFIFWYWETCKWWILW